MRERIPLTTYRGGSILRLTEMIYDDYSTYMNYDYSGLENGGDVVLGTALGAITGVMLTLCVIICLAVFVMNVIGLWKMFSKAGIAGWKCLVPFYSAYLLFKMSFGNGWIFLLGFVPLVNIVIYIVCMVKLAKAFNAGVAVGIGLIFLQPIFVLALGLGKYMYVGPYEDAVA